MTRVDPERFLEYGGVAPARSLDTSAALTYLAARGFRDNYLEQARAALSLRDAEDRDFAPTTDAECDFCTRPLMGGEFDRLADGRQRCVLCSKTVVATHDEFVGLYHEVKRNFEIIFEAQLRAGMTVRNASAKVIARQTNENPRATPGGGARILGFARENAGGYDLYVENGSPKLPAIWTLVHELTHVWQYRAWNRQALRQAYGNVNELVLYEGMASWASAQYFFSTMETDFARRWAAHTRERDDEYGAGFRLFEARYPFRGGGKVLRDTPFKHPLPL